MSQQSQLEPGGGLAAEETIDPGGELRAGDTPVHAAGSRPRTGTWWRHLIALIVVAWALFPVLFVVSAALNPAGTLSATSPIPQHFSTKNFDDLFSSTTFPFWTWFKNSLVVAGLGTLITVFIAAAAAFAFSRLRWRGRRPGLMALLLAQMFPALLAFPALYLMFLHLGQSLPVVGLNTLWGLLLVYLGGAMGANVWLLKGYFDTIPKELDEAAKIDGASHARIFFTMTLRLVSPILATVGILAFVGLWGEFMLASIFLLDQDVRTLGVGLYSLNLADRNRYFGMFAAGALVASIPPVLVYLSLQKQLIGGLTSGSVK
ncbi:sugar ABC transporter permease [Ornithinimicrobium avium]|uniref:Sugar ABC transporter permease n=1 Tax=Ornithinimicrobium avium TaxID=2283195 RepID=A0A345NQQ7_9MICO|nr:sugar ABC transporter permease [Ornithinimicrobium avium]AXH97365.1 sugar ABC transporter permease [Ornithinimicrobium avium]